MREKLYLVEQEHQGVNKNFLVMAKNIGEAEKIISDYLEGKIKSGKSIEIWWFRGGNFEKRELANIHG